MELANWLSILFISTTIATVGLFYLATKKHLSSLILILVLGLIQGVLAWHGFFMDFKAMPPRVAFLLPPAILIMVYTFYSASGKRFINQVDLKMMTLLSVFRVPVEIVLLYLFLSGLLPESMTFGGRNFDIISGLSAPLIFCFAFKNGKINKKLLLVWNVVSFALLIQVVATALISIPSPIQLQAFDKPAIGVLQFPFVWLPGIIVPIVAFTHLVSIQKLRKLLNN